jgi:YebC/PmpR family DNA-binding regulatory protein
MIEVLTDNKNRTVGEIRHLLGKYGGNLGETNSVRRMFDKRGYIVIEKTKAGEDALMAAVLDAGADDLVDDGDNWEVLSSPEAFPGVKDALDKLTIETVEARVSMLPNLTVPVEGKSAQSCLKLLDLLEDHDDVQRVWSNADIDAKEFEAFE